MLPLGTLSMGGFQLISNSLLVKTVVQSCRKHPRRRVEKKLLQRYGGKRPLKFAYKFGVVRVTIPDPHVYFLVGDMVVGHPATINNLLDCGVLKKEK